jgi:OOP family OmpA-OmpF porin
MGTEKGNPTMKQMKIFSLAGAALLVLSGCSTYVDTDSVANMSSKGNAFQQGLHKQYISLANMEKTEDDGEDAQYFVDKAKAAAMGEDVGPQPLAERMLPDSAKSDISAARKNLVSKLWQGGADETPHAAAKAQAMFDCWMQEQEENNQPDHIAACKAGFDKAYALIKTTPPVVAMKAKPKPKMKAKPKPAPVPPLPAPFVVYFDSDSADLDDDANFVLKQAYADYRLHKPGKVRVAGHTDTQGDAKYNMGLSRYRSNEVGNALMTLGVPRGAVEKTRHGEGALAVSTGNNASEKNNRRVSITFVR